VSACQSTTEKVVVTIAAALPRLLSHLCTRPPACPGISHFSFHKTLKQFFFLAVGTAAKTWHFMGCTPGPAHLSPNCCAVSKAGQGAVCLPPPEQCAPKSFSHDAAAAASTHFLG